jgi:hypothetical protein
MRRDEIFEKKTGNLRINVKLRRVLAAVFVVSIANSVCVCVCVCVCVWP